MNKAVVIGGGFAGLSFARSFPGEVVVYNVGISNTAGAVSLPSIKSFNLQECFPEDVILYKARSVKISAYEKEFVKDFREPIAYVVDTKRTLSKLAEGLNVVEKRIRIKDVSDFLSKYDLVVGADGVFSTVGKCLEIPIPKGDDLHVGVQADVKVADPDKYSDVEVYVNDLAPKGYVWNFRIGDREFRAGFGVPVDSRINLIERLNEVLKFLFGTQYSFVRKPFGGFIPTSGPLINWRFRKIVLIGDAAGFCDPLTGGGIVYALSVGRALARNDVKSIEKIRKFLLDRYELKRKILILRPEEWRKLVELAAKIRISPLTPKRISSIVWRFLPFVLTKL